MEATSVEDEGTGGGIDSLVASIVTEGMGEVMMDNEAFWTKYNERDCDWMKWSVIIANRR